MDSMEMQQELSSRKRFQVNAQKLIDITQESFFEGIKLAKEGNRLSDISS